MRVLGIDCGGSHVSCALLEDKKILAQEAIETSAGNLREMLPTLASSLRSLCGKCAIPIESCSGIGIGLPVILEDKTATILSTLDKFRDLPEIDLAAWCRREFGLAMKLENDARLALLGERFAGAAVDARDVVMITLGTGIGGAAMLQGRLLNSRYGQAGCLGGHLVVNFRGRQCKCGAIGCAEAEASTWALEAICREWPGFAKSSLAREGIFNFETLFRSRDAGDTVAEEIFRHCCEVWSALAVSLIHAYGPELVLFGGAVMSRGEEILDPIRKYLALHVWKTVRGVPRVASAALGGDASLFGAEALFERNME